MDLAFQPLKFLDERIGKLYCTCAKKHRRSFYWYISCGSILLHKLNGSLTTACLRAMFYQLFYELPQCISFQARFDGAIRFHFSQIKVTIAPTKVPPKSEMRKNQGKMDQICKWRT